MIAGSDWECECLKNCGLLMSKGEISGMVGSIGIPFELVELRRGVRGVGKGGAGKENVSNIIPARDIEAVVVRGSVNPTFILASLLIVD